MSQPGNQPKWVVGIDLGTTHTAVARASLEIERARPESVAITQLVSAGSVDARPLLPSCLYLPIASEGPQRLPWDAERTYALLAEGGEIFMTMEKTPVANRFAMLRDNFGASWMLLHQPEAP